MEIMRLFDTKEVKLLYMFPFFMWIFITFYFPSIVHYFILAFVFILTSVFYLQLEKTVKKLASAPKDKNDIVVNVFAEKFLVSLMVLVIVSFFATEIYFWFLHCDRIDLVGHYLFLSSLAMFFFGVLYVLMSERLGDLWKNVLKISSKLTDERRKGKPKS